jgi:hypothetical protein
MLIKSDFRDYYDHAMKHGVDRSVVYKRYQRKAETETRKASMYFPSLGKAGMSHRFEVKAEDFVIGFCGLVYPVVRLSPDGWLFDKERREKTRTAFSIKEVDDYVRKEFRAKDSNWYFGRYGARKRFEIHFENVADENGRHAKAFEDNRSPIFVWARRDVFSGGKWESKVEITWDAKLEPFEFIRMFEPYTAYQEIAMWLNNQAEPRKPIPEISDEIMVEIKGFDKRYSFRKDKRA